jgi:hypothetical protein
MFRQLPVCFLSLRSRNSPITHLPIFLSQCLSFGLLERQISHLILYRPYMKWHEIRYLCLREGIRIKVKENSIIGSK